MTDVGPEDQLKSALEAARRQERAERDESVADELEQTDRLVGSIDAIEPKNDYPDDPDTDSNAGDDEQPS